MMMNNEIALIGFGELSQMAATMSKSGLFNKTPDQLLSLMMIAQAESLHPAIAAMEYDVIQGRPALKGQAALARFQQAGGKISWITRNDTEAKAQFTHPAGGELIVSWTIERAKKMNLDQKDNWKKQPGVMLSWRCIAEGVRAIYPACLNRMYLAEEVQDFEPMRDVTPAREPEEVVKIVAKHNANVADDAARDDIQAKRTYAVEIQRALGIKKDEASEIFEACGRDIDVYIAKLEKMKAEAPAPEGDDFQLSGDAPLDLSELIVQLEEYGADETLAATARKEIADAFARHEADPAVLSALLAKVKAAK